MRRRDVDKELADIQRTLNFRGDQQVMAATNSGMNELKMLAFRIGCCRVALDTKESVALQPTTAPCCEGEAPHAETGTSA
jgi:hypothetical protein